MQSKSIKIKCVPFQAFTNWESSIRCRWKTRVGESKKGSGSCAGCFWRESEQKERTGNWYKWWYPSRSSTTTTTSRATTTSRSTPSTTTWSWRAWNVFRVLPIAFSTWGLSKIWIPVSISCSGVFLAVCYCVSVKVKALQHENCKILLIAVLSLWTSILVFLPLFLPEVMLIKVESESTKRWGEGGIVAVCSPERMLTQYDSTT